MATKSASKKSTGSKTRVAKKSNDIETVAVEALSDEVRIEIPGFSDQALLTNLIPPVGTVLRIPKHSTEGGTSPSVVVTGHEWQLKEATSDVPLAHFSVRIRTVIEKPAKKTVTKKASQPKPKQK